MLPGIKWKWIKHLWVDHLRTREASPLQTHSHRIRRLQRISARDGPNEPVESFRTPLLVLCFVLLLLLPLLLLILIVSLLLFWGGPL